jgi:hypothetical protein
MQALQRQQLPLFATLTIGGVEQRFTRVSLLQLGFPNSPSNREFARMDWKLWSEGALQDQEVSLCLPEDTDPLREHYKNQPKGETLRLAMIPLTGQVRGTLGPCILALKHHEKKGLIVYPASMSGGDLWLLHWDVLFRIRTLPS